MPLALQGLDHRIDLAGEQHEVAGDGCRVEAGGLEIDGDRRAHGAGQRHALIGDRLGARNTELVDAAVVLPLAPMMRSMPDRVNVGGGVAVPGGGANGVLLTASAVMEAPRELDRIAVSQMCM